MGMFELMFQIFRRTTSYKKFKIYFKQTMDHIRVECNKINWKTCDQTDEYGHLLCRKKDMCNRLAWLFAYAQKFDTEVNCNGTLGACKDYCEKYCENFAVYTPDTVALPGLPLPVPDNKHIKGGIFRVFECTSDEKYLKIEDMYKTNYDLDQYLSNYIKGTDCTLE